MLSLEKIKSTLWPLFDLPCTSTLGHTDGQHLYWKHQELGRLNDSGSQGLQVVKQYDESDETAALFPQRSFSNNNKDYFKQVQKKKKFCFSNWLHRRTPHMFSDAI